MAFVQIQGPGHIEAANLLSRHPTPRKFIHVLLRGVRGRQAFNALGPSVIMWVYNHGTLGDWAALDARYKMSGGGPGHQFGGAIHDNTPLAAHLDQDGNLRQPEPFASMHTIEAYIGPGAWIQRYRNVTTDAGGKYFAAIVDVANVTAAKAILGASLIYADGDIVASVPAAYRRDASNLRHLLTATADPVAYVSLA